MNLSYNKNLRVSKDSWVLLEELNHGYPFLLIDYE